MRFAAFTLDVDRDVNLPQEGREAAVCRAQEGDCAPRFTSSLRGLELLVEMLDDLGVRGTFFMEAETAENIARKVDLPHLLADHEIAAHGYGHEDLTGESTKVPMEQCDIEAVLDRSLSSVERSCGHRPVGFRAPYLHVNDVVIEAVGSKGFLYDSSIVKPIKDGKIGAYRHSNGLFEVPLAQGKDVRGKKIQSYLWPLHEGKRAPTDFKHLLSQYEEGILVLADHSWHVVETYAGHRSEESVMHSVSDVREVLRSALDHGIEFMTLETYVRTEAGS